MATRSLASTLTATYELLEFIILLLKYTEHQFTQQKTVEELKDDIAIHICEYLVQGNWEFDEKEKKQLSLFQIN